VTDVERKALLPVCVFLSDLVICTVRFLGKVFYFIVFLVVAAWLGLMKVCRLVLIWYLGQSMLYSVAWGSVFFFFELGSCKPRYILLHVFSFVELPHIMCCVCLLRPCTSWHLSSQFPFFSGVVILFYAVSLPRYPSPSLGKHVYPRQAGDDNLGLHVPWSIRSARQNMRRRGVDSWLKAHPGRHDL
jgi:hypothetical protein